MMRIILFEYERAVGFWCFWWTFSIITIEADYMRRNRSLIGVTYDYYCLRLDILFFIFEFEKK